ncbi:MAG: cobalamin biosynthesis protein [Chloroflexota bacterium]|nr:cobalamin biosynthesis protein [Chloroflexota bacterium]MDE2959750.1 cobalamin biosynthesis protein [Chloroflexota bacterium]
MPDPEVASTQTAIIAVSRPGAVLARRLASSIPEATLYLERRTGGNSSATNEGHRYYDLPLRPVIQDLFARHRELVVFLPVGAAVRLLAPVLGSKTQDPAVVCVDDAGRYAVSVLSGHLGGADALANRVADAIGAQAIVTSASDALDVTAIDLVGRDAGWRVEATSADLTRAAAAVVNRDPVALWIDPEARVAWPDDTTLSENIRPVPHLSDVQDLRYAAALIVSDRLFALDTGRPLVTYRPPTLVVGIGCRRGVSEDHLRELLLRTLEEHGLAAMSVAKIATADIKADEAGIIALAQSLSVPVETYDSGQLNSAAATDTAGSASGLHRPTPSAARDLLGVFGVAEPAAMLASGAEGVIVPRAKSDRATIAVARIPSTRRYLAEASAMNQPETMMPGEALLAQAEREIGQGNLRRGAGLVWQAAMEALSAVAMQHGLPCGNREEARQVAKYLDGVADSTQRQDGLALHRNYLAFGTADSFREHNEEFNELVHTELLWEPDEFAVYLDSVQWWIDSLHLQLKEGKAV